MTIRTTSIARSLGLVLLIAGLTRPCNAQESCAPSDTLSRGSSTLLSSGHYRVTVVATDGKARGHRTTGALDLWPTSATDRSPRTGQLAYGDVQRQPLFGSIDLDFTAVNAPVFRGDSITPAPTSRDPVFRGVLVERQQSDEEMLVSTLGNRRTAERWLDGTGIYLRITGSTRARVAGTWDRAGRLLGSRGFFCADRIGDAGRDPRRSRS